MREGLLVEIKDYLAQERIDVSDFALEKVEGLVVTVSADGEVFVFEFDQYWEEAELVSQYPVSMIRKMW